MRPLPSSTASTDRDARRFRAVLEHVDAHLDDDLSLARLSRVAHSSASHFHHQFSERFGLGVHGYVKLARLRRAALQLAFRDRMRVVDVALASGYESPEAFARAFKRCLGATPSRFRAAPDWARFQALERRMAKLRAPDEETVPLPAVRARDVDRVRVAALEVRGRPLRVSDALRTFIAWRRAYRFPPSRSATYNVLGVDDGLDLACAIDRPIAPDGHGVVEKTILGGRYAIARHRGTQAELQTLVHALHERWLPESGEVHGAGPLVIRRLTFFPDVPECQTESEIFLPLR